MAPEDRELDVFLADVPAGRLSLDPGGLASFTFFESYRALHPRPVLGQAFERDLSGRYLGKGRLPVWFSNLLPEGPLRAHVRAGLDPRHKHEIAILRALASDLPGAVHLAPAPSDDTLPHATLHEAAPSDDTPPPARIRFSLSGAQLKLSVLRAQTGRITLPVSGVGGDWILKLPDPHFPGVPTNEHAMMTWAKLAGLDVPDIALVPSTHLDNLDLSLFSRPEPSFLIRRFDRSPSGRRIHIEDMAQVFGFYPDDKYGRRDYHALARVILALTGPTGYDELLRRLVFMVASGNADMHHKNWSLLYPDSVHASLAPAYDFVATITYKGVSDELALKLSGSRRWEDIRLSSFEHLALDAGAPLPHTRHIVEQTIDSLLRSRQQATSLSHLPTSTWQSLSHHWSRVPLLRPHTPW